MIVAVIAASVSLFFSWQEHEQKQMEINRAAIEYARDEKQLEAFQSDPYNAINEMQASFPEHAFCASFGLYNAYFSKLAVADIKADAVGLGSRKDMREALYEEVRRIAFNLGIDIEALEEKFVTKTEKTELNCASIPVKAGMFSNFTVPSECRKAIEAYLENTCLIEREAYFWAEFKAREGKARQEKENSSFSIEIPVEALVEGPPLRVEMPAQAPMSEYKNTLCPENLGVFIQYLDRKDTQKIEALGEALQENGWSVHAPEYVEGKTQGDVRYYWDSQEGCAQILAHEVETLLERIGEQMVLAPFSLEGRYKKLPENVIEIWLPSLGTKG